MNDVVCPHCLGAPPSLPPGAANWLKTGERGLSSEAIFSHLTGFPISGSRLPPPYDSGDFLRCQKLLIAVPSFADRIGEMASVSPVWAVIAAHWAEIDALMSESTTKAYELIRRIHDRKVVL
jgi:hypothetical protein